MRERGQRSYVSKSKKYLGVKAWRDNLTEKGCPSAGDPAVTHLSCPGATWASFASDACVMIGNNNRNFQKLFEYLIMRTTDTHRFQPCSCFRQSSCSFSDGKKSQDRSCVSVPRPPGTLTRRDCENNSKSDRRYRTTLEFTKPLHKSLVIGTIENALSNTSS